MKLNLKDNAILNNSVFKSLTLAGVGFITALALTGQKKEVVHTSVNNDMSAYKLLAEKMDDIQVQIGRVKEEVQKPKEKVDLSSLNQNIQSISGEIRNIKSETTKAIFKTAEQNLDLSKKIDDVKVEVKGISSNAGEIKYIDPKQIPFEVFSIDYVQSSPVVSIRYHYQNYDLEVGEVLAGWKVVSLNYVTQEAEFENINKEHAHLNLKDKGVA
jgi:hypothetical protein